MTHGGPQPSLWRRWVLNPILQQLTQGITPAKIAQAVAFGVGLALFPILGSVTLITTLVGLPLKLNQPILHAAGTLAYPLQIATIVGFYRAGEWLFNAPPVTIHLPTMIERFFAEPGVFFHDYGMTALYGIVVWCLVAPPFMLVLYVIVKPLIEAVERRTKSKAAQNAVGS